MLGNFFAILNISGYKNVLFDRLNSYHTNIKLTIELNPRKFLDTKLTTSVVLINSTFTGKTQNYLHHGPRKLQNVINEIL